MDKNRITVKKLQFDDLIHLDEETNVEYWLARELMKALGYERQENFEKSIQRAIESCNSQGIDIGDHFRETLKVAYLAKNAKRNRKKIYSVYNKPIYRRFGSCIHKARRTRRFADILGCKYNEHQV